MFVLRYFFIVFIGYFLLVSCGGKTDYFSRLNCDDKVYYIQKYNEKLSQKSWYGEGEIMGDMKYLPFSGLKLNFKAYLTPEKAELYITPIKFKNLEVKIIDTPEKANICFSILGVYKCMAIRKSKMAFALIKKLKYWSYNTLTGIFPFKMEDIKSYQCKGDEVLIKLAENIQLKYNYIYLKEFKVSNDVKMQGFNIKYDYLIRYDYDGNKLKSIDFDAKFGNTVKKLKLDYELFKELKEKM